MYPTLFAVLFRALFNLIDKIFLSFDMFSHSEIIAIEVQTSI